MSTEKANDRIKRITRIELRKRYARWMGEQGRIFATNSCFLVLMILDIGLCYLSQMPVPIAGITCTRQLAASPDDRRIPLEW